jgi:hypothetical protein
MSEMKTSISDFPKETKWDVFNFGNELVKLPIGTIAYTHTEGSWKKVDKDKWKPISGMLSWYRDSLSLVILAEQVHVPVEE